MPRRLLVALVLTAAGSPLHAQGGPPAIANGFDEWVREVMAEWKVPGLAVGAVRDGEAVLLEGYGFRDVESRLPVTPRTLMAIGSNSKSFTVVLMGRMVDRGALDWDRPVREYLPDFRLYDDYATRHLRVRDLVTHVSGLPRHDALWYGRTLDRAEIFSRLRYLEPTTSFRGRWQYQNLMFLTAGYLLERMTGRTWDEMIDTDIFTPLGMGRSNTTVRDMPGSDDFAYPYVLDEGEGEVRKVPFRLIDNVAPAGSINSSVEEMVRYIQLHLDSGLVGGDTLLTPDNAVMMGTAQSVVGSGDRYPELGPATYGLGLTVTSYRGHKMVGHGGGIDGFVSAMRWLPNANLGVVVLTNLSGLNPVPTIVANRVLDDLLGLEPIDWNRRVRDRRQEELGRMAEELAERLPDGPRRFELDAYAGTYEHPGYGTVRIRVEHDALRATFDQFDLALEHRYFDVFAVDAGRTVVPLEGSVHFLTNDAGVIDRMTIPFEPALDPIVFVKAGTEP